MVNVHRIVLPVMLTSVSKIEDGDVEYDKAEYIRDKQHVIMYQAHFQQSPHNVNVSKFLKKMTMILHKYYTSTRIPKDDNLINHYIKNEESGWEELIKMSRYIKSVDYHNIGQDDVLYK